MKQSLETMYSIGLAAGSSHERVRFLSLMCDTIIDIKANPNNTFTHKEAIAYLDNLRERIMTF